MQSQTGNYRADIVQRQLMALLLRAVRGSGRRSVHITLGLIAMAPTTGTIKGLLVQKSTATSMITCVRGL